MAALTTQLDQLENAQLVRRAPREELSYLFKHAMTQESAYESLLLKKRSEIHRLVAEAYERLYAERLDDFAVLLAQHYSEVGDDVKTVEWATRAGDAAARVYAHIEAISAYTLALEAAKRCASTGEQISHIYRMRGRAFELSNQFDRALDNYTDLQVLATQRGERGLELESLMLRATIRSTPTPVFDAAQAQALSDRALALAHQLGNRQAEAKIFWDLMLLNFQLGRAPRALSYGEQSLQIAQELDLREQIAFTSNDLGRAYLTNGQVARAEAMLEQSRVLWRELDNRPMLADNLVASSLLAFLKGDFAHGLKLAEEGVRISQAIGNSWAELNHRHKQMMILAEQGEFAEALSGIDEILRRLQELAPAQMLAVFCSQAACIYGSLGAFDRAGELA